MQGLIIKDEIYWHDDWSAEIGRKLKVKDSSNNMYVFEPDYDRADILRVLKEVPERLYEIFEVEETSEEECEFMADSGKCYRTIH